MSQNILVTVLTVLFYFFSMLGGGTDMTVPTPSSPIQSPSAENPSVAGRQGVVLGDRVTLRQGPGTEHSAITALNKNDTVTVLDSDNGWYKVRLGSGQTGWVAGSLLELRTREPRTDISSGRDVIGYYMAGSPSYDSMVQYGQALTAIAPWSWAIDSYGGIQANFNTEQKAETLQFAGNAQLDTYALITNYFNNTFDSRVVSALLNNPIAQERAISQLSSTLKDWGMSGINLDFENVPAKDRSRLTDFVAKLSERLRSDGLTVTMAVPAKTSDNLSSDFSGAYDYAALARHVDRLVIMAYDQHWRGGAPGPVASVQWVESVIKYAIGQAPAEKIVLGIPAYGYDWARSGQGQAVTYKQAMERAAQRGSSVRWHSEHRVPYFEYANGGQVWFENRYSIKYKLDLIKQYNLAGMALWRLGQEDPGIWKVIQDTL